MIRTVIRRRKTPHLEKENARLRAELYGKKSERTVASDLDITIEEVPTKEEPEPTAADGTRQNKTDKPAKRTRSLRVHYTREIEVTLIPDEVKANSAAYERLSESAERMPWPHPEKYVLRPVCRSCAARG